MSFTQTQFNQSQVNVIRTLITNWNNLMKGINTYVWVNRFYCKPNYCQILLKLDSCSRLIFLYTRRILFCCSLLIRYEVNNISNSTSLYQNITDEALRLGYFLGNFLSYLKNVQYTNIPSLKDFIICSQWAIY